MIYANRKETTYASDRVPTACERLGQTQSCCGNVALQELPGLGARMEESHIISQCHSGQGLQLGSRTSRPHPGKSMAGAGSNTKYDAFIGEHTGPTVKTRP